MDIIMQKMAATTNCMILSLALASCANQDYRHEVKVPGSRGKFYVSKAGTAIPLSADLDAVDYEVGSKSIRIFSGSGGKNVSLSFDTSNRLLVIGYCGGRIESVLSSFSDLITTKSEGWKIYRTQVINNSGVSYKGNPICD